MVGLRAVGRTLLLLVLFAVAGGATARAGIELGNAGNFGEHGVTDTRESPGATCRFAPPLAWSLGETWLQVRPPLMVARDTTPAIDEQLVGWRAIVAAWDRASAAWKPFAEGQTQRAVAAENRAAQFDSRGPEAHFHLGYGSYLVTLELFWYERLAGDGEPRLAGQAEYRIEYYAIAVRDRRDTIPSGVNTACRLEA